MFFVSDREGFDQLGRRSIDRQFFRSFLLEQINILFLPTVRRIHAFIEADKRSLTNILSVESVNILLLNRVREVAFY